MPMLKFYMHTLNGQPASYDEGRQICFATFYGKPNKLCSSLEQIRYEQKKSAEWRLKQGLTDHCWKAGYFRFAI